MPDRLVDVVDNTKNAVLHTFPVAIEESEAPRSADFERKAAEAAAYVPLVPEDELVNLSAQMHVDRGGPLQPYGDPHHPTIGTRESLDQRVREEAYHLWQAEGCPEGHAEANWFAAEENDVAQRAHRLWKLEGCPDDKADEHWHRARTF